MFGNSRLKAARRTAATLYDACVAQARQPAFFASAGAPDTVDGRFDLIAVHLFLAMRRLKQEGGDEAVLLAQALADRFSGDMDLAIRELGVGDLSVGKRVKAMVAAFYGRVTAYDTALAADAPEPALAAAVERNVWRSEAAPRAAAFAIARYMIAACAALERQSMQEIGSGRLAFPPAEAHVPVSGAA